MQDLMSLALTALGMVVIATGAFDLAARPSLAGIIDDEGALGARPQVIGVIHLPSQFRGQTPPIDVFAAQEIIEHADLAGQDLAQFGAEAVEGFYFHQRIDQQGAEQVGQRLPVGAALAADGRGEQSDQRVTLEAFGEFGVDEGQGLAEGIGQGGIGAGLAAGLFGLGPGRGAGAVFFIHR
jgi:hypothetical protein